MNKKTLPQLASRERRTFMRNLGLFLGTAATPALQYAIDESLFGVAHAQAQPPPGTYFVEISYRDQVDLGEVFVAPGLATATNLVRGENGDRCAMFYQQADLTLKPGNVYLTPESKVLEPHVDNIACIDLCEMTPGAIHYHNSANRNRAPDCSYTQGAGMQPMFARDPVSNFPQGCERYYSAMPTPASMHNSIQKQLTPGLQNGVAIKGISRPIHTVYHTGGGLPGAELDRMRSKRDLFAAFPKTTTVTPAILGTPAEAELFRRVLRHVDPKFLQSRERTQQAIAAHLGQLDEAHVPLTKVETQMFDLALTPAEVTAWKTGVPEPTSDGFVEGQDERPGTIEFQIWEQYALATKLLLSGKTRTVSLECEFIDIHERRPRKQMQVHSKQLAIPLARMIAAFKAAGIWDRTVIAIYTADGSRPPAAGYSGDRGKNTVMLAGGGIKGGYFGDIRLASTTANGHTYRYHMPDLATGAPIADGATDNSKRVPGAVMWRTVAKAMGATDALVNQFAAVRNVSPLAFALK